MKICIVSKEYPNPEGFGGVGTYTYNMALGLVKNGHQVAVITQTWPWLSGESMEDGIRVIRIPVPELDTHQQFFSRLKSIILPYTMQRKLWTRNVMAKLYELIHKESIQLVELSEYSLDSIPPPLPGSVRLVVRQHSPWDTVIDQSNRFTPLDTLLQKRFRKYLAKSADLVTCPSEKLADLIEKKWKISPYKIVIYPNMLDTDFYRPRKNIAVEKNTLLYAGRIERMKGLECLIRALVSVKKAVPDIRLRIINAGSFASADQMNYEKNIKQKIRNYGLEKSIEIKPRMNQNELIDEYCRAAVAVVPSLWESLPYAVLEPMSCARPVVASRCGGIPEIIQDQHNGLLAEPLNVSSFCGKILRILRN
ncbi:MAG: glycosyltransferase family 4 protein, partial [Elusimicrobiota bacterium]